MGIGKVFTNIDPKEISKASFELKSDKFWVCGEKENYIGPTRRRNP